MNANPLNCNLPPLVHFPPMDLHNAAHKARARGFKHISAEGGTMAYLSSGQTCQSLACSTRAPIRTPSIGGWYRAPPNSGPPQVRATVAFLSHRPAQEMTLRYEEPASRDFYAGAHWKGCFTACAPARCRCRSLYQSHTDAWNGLHYPWLVTTLH